MKRENKPITLSDVNDATKRSNYYVSDFKKKAEKLNTDSEKDQRLKERLCLFCYYLNSWIGGATMTEANCGMCQKMTMYSSTCVDVVCTDCADKHKICVHCGADRELKQRKKL